MPRRGSWNPPPGHTATTDWCSRWAVRWSSPTSLACGSSVLTSTPTTQRPGCKPTYASLGRAPLTRQRRVDAAAATVVVVGAGLTGIEEATGLPAMLADNFAARAVAPRVVLIDRHPFVGP